MDRRGILFRRLGWGVSIFEQDGNSSYSQCIVLGVLGGPCLPRDRTRASSMQSRTPACWAIYHTQEMFPVVTLLLNWGLLAWTHAQHTPISGSSLCYICLRPMERKVRAYTLFQMPISQTDIGLSSFCATYKSILSLLHSLRPWGLRDIFDYSPGLAWLGSGGFLIRMTILYYTKGFGIQ